MGTAGRSLDEASARAGTKGRFGLVGCLNSLILCLLALPGHAEEPAPATAQTIARPERYEDGDLLFRRTTGFWADMAARLSRGDRRFSHVGIVRVVGTTPTVIHANGDPTAFGARVVSQDVETFLRGSIAVGLYRLRAPERIRSRIATVAQTFVDRELPFDTRFDLTTPDALYCSELVARAVEASLGRGGLFAVADGPLGQPYIPIDALQDTRFAEEVYLRSDMDLLN